MLQYKLFCAINKMWHVQSKFAQILQFRLSSGKEIGRNYLSSKFFHMYRILQAFEVLRYFVSQ